MKRRWINARSFVITTIIAGAAVMGVRIEAMRDVIVSGKAFRAVATATAEDTQVTKADLAQNPTPDGKAVTQAATKTENKPASEAPAPAPPRATVDVPTLSGVVPQEMTTGEIEILKQLSSRRAALDQREQELSQKGALLQAAEQRVEGKIKQMEVLRSQLQGMLTQLDEQQQAQIANLVKIYETMKPADAARILQHLEMPVLLGVMKQMKPARSAPILAEMEAAKAKEITVTLANINEIPNTKLAK